jgi:hypothetical protein
VRKRTASSTSRKVRPWSFVVHEWCIGSVHEGPRAHPWVDKVCDRLNLGGKSPGLLRGWPPTRPQPSCRLRGILMNGAAPYLPLRWRNCAARTNGGGSHASNRDRRSPVGRRRQR